MGDYRHVEIDPGDGCPSTSPNEGIPCVLLRGHRQVEHHGQVLFLGGQALVAVWEDADDG